MPRSKDVFDVVVPDPDKPVPGLHGLSEAELERRLRGRNLEPTAADHERLSRFATPRPTGFWQRPVGSR